MAQIVAGIGSSHVPAVGAAFDQGKQDTPEWKPLFDGYRPVMQWLNQAHVDLAIFIYNDHGTDFFFDKYPTFAMGVGNEFAIADEGWGKRPLGPVPGDPEFSWHVAQSLIVESEFDVTVCQEMALDHGLLTPLPLLWSHKPHWAIKVLPIFVNVIQHPLPTARRLWKLGKALRKAVESYPKDVRVAVIGTGGLSHQLHGERFGFRNEQWDLEFMDRIVRDPESLVDISHHEYMARGGAEAVEMIMWLGMRGAMSAEVKLVHKNYYAPMLTGMGLLLLEDAITPAAS
ncbi:MAG: class III extradiol dioxygenase family protein [Candidatus Binatia bacterium]